LLRKRAADFDNTMDVRAELNTMDIMEHVRYQLLTLM
jgi:hypothetical protein